MRTESPPTYAEGDGSSTAQPVKTRVADVPGDTGIELNTEVILNESGNGVTEPTIDEEADTLEEVIQFPPASVEPIETTAEIYQQNDNESEDSSNDLVICEDDDLVQGSNGENSKTSDNITEEHINEINEQQPVEFANNIVNNDPDLIIDNNREEINPATSNIEIENTDPDQPGSQEHEAICPDTTIRKDNILYVVYPLDNGPLPCTESACRTRVHQKQWSHRKGKLLTHLKNAHNIIIKKENVINWCKICGVCLGGMTRIRSHHCLKNIPQLLTDPAEYQRLPFKCLTCKAVAYDTVTALNNHIHKHEREAREEMSCTSSVTTTIAPSIISNNTETEDNGTEYTLI